MAYRDILPWGNCPYHLSFEEVQDPLLVLRDFFGDWPQTHAKDLLKWRDAMFSRKPYKDKIAGPGFLLLVFKQYIRLVECCYLLLVNYRVSSGRRNRINEDILKSAKDDWWYYPDNLSVKQRVDPYLVIKKAFQNAGLYHYRNDLDEWLYFGLNKERIDMEGLNMPVATLYETLLKLQSAAWVIWQTESGKPFLKSDFMNSNEGKN